VNDKKEEKRKELDFAGQSNKVEKKKHKTLSHLRQLHLFNSFTLLYTSVLRAIFIFPLGLNLMNDCR